MLKKVNKRRILTTEMGWLWKLAGISRRQRKKKWWYQTKIKWNRLTMSKRTYSKEEVMYDRQQSVSKTGNNGRNSVMQSHRRQPTSKDGRVKRKKRRKKKKRCCSKCNRLQRINLTGPKSTFTDWHRSTTREVLLGLRKGTTSDRDPIPFWNDAC